MWVIVNHYKDQQEDLEKYKLICRFVNPDAAHKVWDAEAIAEESSLNDEFLSQIRQHTKSDLSTGDLMERINNPEKYDMETIDTIERVD